MSKRKTAEEILSTTAQWPYTCKSDLLEAIREGMRQERDAALEWAAGTMYDDGKDPTNQADFDLIISGKTHPDLEIK